MVSRSTVFRVRPKSNSLRAVIPDDVVSALGLNHGDNIEWTLKPQGKIIVAVVSKAKVK